MSDAPDSDSSMPESTVPTLESRPPLLPSSVDNDYKCTTITITESCVCYISNSTTAPANTRTCQTYFNIPVNLHSFIHLICWEAGVWFPALNNFCHSFLCSDVLFSATYFRFIRYLSRCILFLPAVAFPLILPSIISCSNDSCLSICPIHTFAFSHCV